MSIVAELLCKATTDRRRFLIMLHTVVIKNGARHFGTWDGTVRRLGPNCL